MLEKLKHAVYEANMALPKYNLVTLTWGNVSAYDATTQSVVIKPSGVPYEELTPESMVVVDLQGRIKEGHLKPSSDTPTHCRLYQTYPEIGSVLHTHSRWATIFAQAHLDIPALGTTHADYFKTAIPVTEALSVEQIEGDYEFQTAIAMETMFQTKGVTPMECPAVLVREHGPFVFAPSPKTAVEIARVLEEVAFMAYHTVSLNSQRHSMQTELHQKHYTRKHGSQAYYGQTK